MWTKTALAILDARGLNFHLPTALQADSSKSRWLERAATGLRTLPLGSTMKLDQDLPRDALASSISCG